MQLTILASATEEAPRVARAMEIGQANEAVATLSMPSEATQRVIGGLTEAGNVVEPATGVMDTWQPLLKGIGKFIEVTDKITEVSDERQI